MIAALPPNEAERLRALHQYDILDTDPELAFDDITLLASQICGTEIAMISLVDRDRQWFKSKVGTTMSGTSRTSPFARKPNLVRSLRTSDRDRVVQGHREREEPFLEHLRTDRRCEREHACPGRGRGHEGPSWWKICPGADALFYALPRRRRHHGTIGWRRRR